MCGGSTPTQATVDPAAERQKAADEAAAKANQQLVMDSRRRRGQQGLLSSENNSVLGQALAPTTRSRPTLLSGVVNKRWPKLTGRGEQETL